MATIPFSIDGNNIQCPDKWEPDLASSLHPYQDGSPLYEGRPLLKLTWNFLPDNEVALIRTTFDTLVTGFNPGNSFGTPIAVTVPDLLNGGLKVIYCYFTEPTGTAAGDGTRNFSITLYCLNEDSFQAALGSPEGDLWFAVTSGAGVVFGASQYTGTGWLFW